MHVVRRDARAIRREHAERVCRPRKADCTRTWGRNLWPESPTAYAPSRKLLAVTDGFKGLGGPGGAVPYPKRAV